MTTYPLPPRHHDVADLERVLEQRRRTTASLRSGNQIDKSGFTLAAHMHLISVAQFDQAFRTARP